MFSHHRSAEHTRNHPQRLGCGVQLLVTKWLSTIALAIVVGSISSLPTSARGGQSSEDPWNPCHINQLPVEIRNAPARMCGSPEAAHYFATYFDNSRVIKLHFEKLLCDGKGPFCTPGGCLHQTYVLTGSRYRLSRSYYAPGTD
jgi:hypothetical protein